MKKEFLYKRNNCDYLCFVILRKCIFLFIVCIDCVYNNILNPLETSLPGIINSDKSDNITVSLFLYKYSDVPLRNNSEKPSIFKYISNMDYYPIDAINFSESYRKFIASYQNAEISTESLNNTSTFKTSINQYVENGSEYNSEHKSLYVLGSAPYMYRAFRFLKESYEKKKAIIERYFPIFDPNYNYDTSASKPEKEVFVDDNGFLVDKKENGKRIKLSAFQMFDVPNSVEVYLGIKEIEIPFQTTELTNSENSDANRIIMAKFPRYLLDDDIEHYNAIKYIRIVNYTAGSTKFYYSKQSLVNDNDKQPLTAKYGSQLAELNIFAPPYEQD